MKKNLEDEESIDSDSDSKNLKDICEEEGYISESNNDSKDNNNSNINEDDNENYFELTDDDFKKYVDFVDISFPETADFMKDKKKCVLTGNPVREELIKSDYNKSREALGLGDKPFILIFGGSLGAELVNKAAMSLIEHLGDRKVKVCFITGRRYFDAISADLKGKTDSRVVLMPYADNMPQLMVAGDIAVSRAGAIAVSELMVCGKPCVLIPSPNVTNNHQFYNAKAVADQGGAFLLEEKVLNENIEALGDAVFSIADDPAKRQEMAAAARKLATPQAAETIYNNLDL